MAEYEEVGEHIIVANPEDGECFAVEFAADEQPIANPAPRIKTSKRKLEGFRIEVPLGEFESFRVRLALVRPVDYDKSKSEIVAGSNVVYKIMKTTAGLSAESVYVLLLNARNRLLGIHEISMGGVTKTVVEPVRVFQAAMLSNASAIVMVHNHPSGSPEPSSEDVALARRVQDLGEQLGIKMLDFVIVGIGEYVSFADRGLI
jgi:DNA repair protein RadC